MTTTAPAFRPAERPRTPLTVDLVDGSIEAGGHHARFDPAEQDAAELAYLKLVRRMRDVHREPSFVLRSDDVEALASALDEDPVTVLERLGALMGATVTQRRSMVAAFLAGALLIVVATSAVAFGPDSSPATDRSDAGDDLADAPEGVAPPAADETGSPDADRLNGDPTDLTASDGDTDPPSADGRTAVATSDGPGTAASASSTSTPGRSQVAPDPAGGPADDPPPRSRTADRDGAPARGPAPGLAPGRDPAPSPAPPVTGEPDAWLWGQPRVDQPGAVIDLPSDPDDGEPDGITDRPGDEDPADEVAGG